MRLDGRVAVITGAGSGMGAAMTRLFAAEGARIVAADWHGQDLERVVADVAATGAAVRPVRGDVSDRADAERMAAEAVDGFGRLDVLVNNAGVMDTNQGAGEMDDATWRRVLGINLDGPMFLTRAAIPAMRAAGGGSIVNVASVAALGGGAAGLAYTVSKHGLVGLTVQTAWRYALEGIRCNAIAAGATDTNIMQSVDPAGIDPDGIARSQAYYAAIPRTLDPGEIARLALFLASDDASGVNGAVVPADGGWAAA